MRRGGDEHKEVLSAGMLYHGGPGSGAVRSYLLVFYVWCSVEEVYKNVPSITFMYEN